MITLTAGDSSVVIAPGTGGAMLGWTSRAVPVLRHADPDAILHGRVRGLAGFPLVPFSNRIAYGRFTWEGRSWQLERNFGDHPHTIHGVGWQRPWEVADVSPGSVRLVLDHTAEGEQARHWPFAFRAELDYALDGGGLRVRLRMENRHRGPAPAGLGLHPYFPRLAGATLRFKATGVWQNGADSLPSQHIPVPPEWDHADGLAVGSASLDNLFTGWDGIAHIAVGTALVELTADAIFRRLVVYTPPGRDYFCVEPVSHMTDAINHLNDGRDTGLRILEAGEALEGSIRFRLTA